MSSQESEIEVDLSSDPEYASSYHTDTTSLSSSINEYVFENGRRYHSYFGVEKNLMPTDEKEQDRLDLHHEILIRLFDGRLHKAPLDHPQRILDVGTGTGIWAIDMADQYPMAEVVGMDLSPIQPKWVPPNCKFEVDDAEKDWAYKKDSFDFIHIRNLAQGISNWPKVLDDAYHCLQPGGYIELSDTGVTFHCDDGTMLPDNTAKCWGEAMTEAMAKAGRPPPSDARHLRDRLTAAGLVDVHSYAIKQPFGPWAKDKRLKEAGIMIWIMAEEGFTSYGLAAFTRMLGMDSEEAAKLCRDGYQATRERKSHLYTVHYVAYGRKPEE
ncbi:S-adenosyl-L-methionine-dependent methyltransferase [Tricharina praecox]|uniref:S-adenosyl-L-methionine-dependent methyltransferase n=1 Tax=Tricharina praecox TaxID=43433 RepID=UPI00221F6EBF|nr:S-adenosyl-L-methionine-dependent methyltransferase [Tricharina praecox]KAI5844900.1 S-adenosyl-L-methionine-dependent methyltransferase [Tricharina praecox]